MKPDSLFDVELLINGLIINSEGHIINSENIIWIKTNYTRILNFPFSRKSTNNNRSNLQALRRVDLLYRGH